MEPGGIIEISDVVVVGNLAARVKDHNHDANGVAISTLLVASPQVVHRTLKLVTK